MVALIASHWFFVKDYLMTGTHHQEGGNSHVGLASAQWHYLNWRSEALNCSDISANVSVEW